MKRSKSILLLLVLILTATSGSIVLSSCGKSADAAKDEKPKKKKKKKKATEEIVSNSGDENANNSEHVSKDDSKNTNSNAENPEPAGADEPLGGLLKTAIKGGKVPPNNSVSQDGDRIWKDLIKGNERFVAGKYSAGNLSSLRKQLAGSQKPEVIILGCADSRVPPELVFDKQLGELFVVRAAGSIADSISLGSIEYAIEHLNSKVLVILGHSGCGAVAAAVSNEEMPSKNLSAIVNRIKPALEGSKSCPLGSKMSNSCVELNVEKSSKDVLAKSLIIKQAQKDGKLTIIRAMYDLESGKVTRME